MQDASKQKLTSAEIIKNYAAVRRRLLGNPYAKNKPLKNAVTREDIDLQVKQRKFMEGIVKVTAQKYKTGFHSVAVMPRTQIDRMARAEAVYKATQAGVVFREGVPLERLAKFFQATQEEISSLIEKHRNNEYKARKQVENDEYIDLLIQQIFDQVCDKYDVTYEDICRRDKRQHLVEARWELFFRLRNEVVINGRPISLLKIGRLTNKDHSTVFNGIKKHAKMIGVGK